MQEIIFKPKYPSQLIPGILILALIESFLLWQIIIEKDISIAIISATLFFGILLIIQPIVHIKRIIFRENNFSIEQLILPTKTIDYSNIIDIGEMALKTQNEEFSFRAMTNSKELNEILKELIQKGVISRHQLDNELEYQEGLFLSSFKIAGLISIILWAIASIIFQHNNFLVQRASIIVFFLPVYVMVYLVLKRRSDNQ